MAFWILILQQVNWNLWKVTTGNKWTKTKTKWKREPRNSTQCCSYSMETRMECIVCVRLVFVAHRTKMSPDRLCVYMCVRVTVVACISGYLMCIFFLHSATKRNSGKNLTKCVFLFISSGYNIVTSLWWEFLFLVGWAKKKKGTQYSMLYEYVCKCTWTIFESAPYLKKERKEMKCSAKKKSVRSLVDISDNRCRLFTATKEQKLHIKCSML